MNWVIPLLQVAYGFFRGVEQGYADRQAGRRLQHEDQAEYDWQQHMIALSATGASLLKVKPSSAMFDVEFQGANYPVVLLRQGHTVLMSICSGITFPSERAPRDISAGLSRANARLERCDYDLVQGDNGDFYCVQSRINLDRLTPDTFYVAVNDMLPHILVLDKYLIENDFDR